ncbi:SDR family NAD(P)-dependent oxidoreductase [Thalassotalea ganghwensis]
MKQIVITGASSGIGQALAKAYAERGENVYACGRNQSKLAQMAKDNEHIHPVIFDVTEPEQIKQAASDVPTIDLLVLNAGDCQYIDDVINFESEKFKQVIKVNLLSLGDLLHEFLPKLSQGGRVVFISSLATVLPFTRNQAYGSSKAAINYLAESLAVDLANTSINVTLVQPGFVKTPLTDKNDFEMPFIMTPEEAANRIISGLDHGKSSIVFPKRLAWLLTFLSWLPSSWVQPILQKDNK